MRLSDYAGSRDNNFNLIRIAAAYGVLVTHGFAIAVGTSEAEPLRGSLGMTIGSIAVDVFFIASGFLVTASLSSRQSVREFIKARFFRIFPALFVALMLSVFCLGPFFTRVPLQSYFADSKTWRYLLKGLTLFSGVAYELPGVFAENPYAGAVNGSLWTLPYEARMYVILASVWAFLRLVFRTGPSAFKASVIAGAAISGAAVLLDYLGMLDGGGPFARLFFMFFTGASFFMLKDRILLSRRLFYAVAAVLLVSTVDKDVFSVVYTLTVAYLLFYAAYVPAGFIRAYNRLGDYSYGIYIYAFPVQQSIASLVPGIGVLWLNFLSTLITAALAVLSWHFVERRALGLKNTAWGRSDPKPPRAESGL